MSELTSIDPALKDQLTGLCAEFNSTRDKLLAACGGSHESLVYEATDLDLGTLLVQVVPILLSMLTGGFNSTAILSVVKILLPMIVKNQSLADVLYKIIEALVANIGTKS